MAWNSECMGGFFGLEFRMHEGVLWPGIPNAWGGSLAWNSECMGGFFGLEFRMHEGVSSPGIPKEEGLKTVIY